MDFQRLTFNYEKMFIEQPPLLYRILFPRTIWKFPDKQEKCVYLTFDDGPIPEVTPWVLDVLDRYQVKATFFMVGENVWRHPDVYRQVLVRGHAVGNHTYNHVQGICCRTCNYIANVRKASEFIPGLLFRPPHGHIRLLQLWALQTLGYKVVMWDVVTRDYSPNITPQDVLQNVQRYVRNGSIIVFHDSLKAEQNMRWAMPRAVEWLLNEGYNFRPINGVSLGYPIRKKKEL